MPQHLAHYLGIDTHAEQQRRTGMTQIMKADLRQFCSGEKPQKSTVDVSANEWSAEFCAENKLAIYIGCSNERSFRLLLQLLVHVVSAHVKADGSQPAGRVERPLVR